MAVRTSPPFRADHVGSLLRPPELLAARSAHAAGRLDDAGLRAAEDEAVASVVAMQHDVGLASATDGEFRRSSWNMDFIYRLGGIEPGTDAMQIAFRNAEREVTFTPPTIRVAAPVRLAEPIFLEDFAFLRDAVVGATAKMTIPSPSMVHYRGGRAAIDPTVYPGIDEFWADLVAAYREEVVALGRAGCTYLQFDDTSLAYMNDPAQRAYVATLGGDALHQHETYIAHLNEVIAARPASMAVTTHLCRGNYRSSWAAEGGYDFVAEALFNELAVDGFFLEFDDERSGGFEPLRFVPPGKYVVLGLVTTKRPELEDRDAVMRRIEEASHFIPLDQLCLSPQCGFSSTVEGNELSADDQRRKLELVVQVAEVVWG